ncbi:MAG: AraC family transcriptional regulator [Edaphobacter sp.]
MASSQSRMQKPLDVSLPETLEEARGQAADRPLHVILSLLDREKKEGGPTGEEYLYHLKSAGETRLDALKNNLTHVIPRWSIAAGLQSVLEEIQVDPTRHHSVENMAEISGFSRGHFIRSFRSFMGVTPHQYLIHQRLERAKNLILTTQQSIAKIAVSCGFATESHFYRAFTKHLGVTPTSLRGRIHLGRKLN